MPRRTVVAVATLAALAAAWPVSGAERPGDRCALPHRHRAHEGHGRRPARDRPRGSRGLDVLDLTWEDTGRYKGSWVGPNISDMTIQVQMHEISRARRRGTSIMPVIRFPTFQDKTADISIDDVVCASATNAASRCGNVTLTRLLPRSARAT